MALLLSVIGCWDTGKRPKVAAVTSAARPALHTAAATSTATAAPADVPSDRTQLDRLQSALDSIDSQELSETSIHQHIQDVSSHIADLQNILSASDQGGTQIEEAAKVYRLREIQAKDAALTDLGSRLSDVNAYLAQMKTLDRQWRDGLQANGFYTAPQVQNLEWQISALETQKLQLEWQIKSRELASESYAAGLAQNAQTAQAQNRADRATIQGQLTQARQELDYWQRQEKGLGSKTQRQQRAQALQGQIDSLQARMSSASQ